MLEGPESVGFAYTFDPHIEFTAAIAAPVLYVRQPMKDTFKIVELTCRAVLYHV